METWKVQIAQCFISQLTLLLLIKQTYGTIMHKASERQKTCKKQATLDMCHIQQIKYLVRRTKHCSHNSL